MTQPAVKPERKSAKTLTEFMQAPPKRMRPETYLEKAEKARGQVREMCGSGDWSGAVGLHLVALYEFLHREVYGVEPLELDARAWFLAQGTAGRMVERYFGGDCGACVSFVRWAWRREQEREEWRRRNNRDGQRIGWRLMFSAALVSDYRVHGKRVGP